MSIRVTIHSTGMGTCSLTGKEESDGLTVTFEDGTVTEGFLSFKAFKQLLGMKSAAGKKKPEKPEKPEVKPLSPPLAQPANGTK